MSGFTELLESQRGDSNELKSNLGFIYYSIKKINTMKLYHPSFQNKNFKTMKRKQSELVVDINKSKFVWSEKEILNTSSQMQNSFNSMYLFL